MAANETAIGREFCLDDDFFADLEQVATACGGWELAYCQSVRVMVAKHPDKPHASTWRMDATNGTAIHTVLPPASLDNHVVLNIPQNTIESIVGQARRWTGLVFNHLLVIEERPWPYSTSGMCQYATFMEPQRRIGVSVVSHDVAWPHDTERLSPWVPPLLRPVEGAPVFHAGDALRAYAFLDLRDMRDLDHIGHLCDKPEAFFIRGGHRQVVLMPAPGAAGGGDAHERA